MATYMKSREEGCCSVNFLKYLLFIFNFIFFLAGCTVLGIGIWTVLEKHQYIALLTTDTYAAITYLLILAGAITIIVSILGCVGISEENRCVLLVYTFMLLLIFVLEAVAGITAYIYEDQVWLELKTNMNETFLKNYDFDDAKTNAIDKMQMEYKCCGAFSFEDWEQSAWRKKAKDKEESMIRRGLKKREERTNLVPESCCISFGELCAFRDHPSNIYYDGCIHSFIEKNLRDHLIILGAVGLGICLVQIFGMIFSCCLYFKLRDYEYNY